MKSRAIAVVVLAFALASMAACGGGSQNQVTTPTTVTTQLAATVTVDTMAGQWAADPVTDQQGIDAREAVAGSSCSQIEFKISRDVDSKTATIVFAATCARVRLRGEGKGLMSGDILIWKAEGVATLPDGKTCPFRFVEGNKAQPMGDGIIKVAYNGTVCGAPVSGTEIIHRK